MSIQDIDVFKELSPYEKIKKALTYSDDESKLELLYNSEFLDGLDSYDILDIIKSLSGSSKFKIIRDLDFIQKTNLDADDLKDIILSLDNSFKKDLLLDKELIKNGLKMPDDFIAEIARKS